MRKKNAAPEKSHYVKIACSCTNPSKYGTTNQKTITRPTGYGL